MRLDILCYRQAAVLNRLEDILTYLNRKDGIPEETGIVFVWNMLLTNSQPTDSEKGNDNAQD
jgi:hypothetical protein